MFQCHGITAVLTKLLKPKPHIVNISYLWMASPMFQLGSVLASSPALKGSSLHGFPILLTLNEFVLGVSVQIQLASCFAEDSTLNWLFVAFNAYIV